MTRRMVSIYRQKDVLDCSLTSGTAETVLSGRVIVDLSVLTLVRPNRPEQWNNEEINTDQTSVDVTLTGTKPNNMWV